MVAEGSIGCALDIDGRTTTVELLLDHERRPTLDVCKPENSSRLVHAPKRVVSALPMHVVVVGGGPVGLVTSIALSAFGISNTVVERSVDVYGLPRAIVMDAEVRHSLARFGLASQLEKVLEPMLAADFVDAAGKELTGINLKGIEMLGCPVVSKHFQPMLDAMLRDEARNRGAELMLGREVIEHRADASGVEVRLDDGGMLRADYLVACDGASSRTRKSMDIRLEDLGFEQDWLVVDIELLDREQARLPDLTRQVCDPRRPTTLVSGFHNYYRFEFQLQPGEKPAEMSAASQVWNLLSPWVSSSQARIVRTAAYRFHAVVAERLREGRVLLAGDSAHQMPPFMGQGLNSGMRDAFNLSWKLAYVGNGWSTAGLLDSYSAERLPHVRDVVEQSVETGRLIDQFAGRVSHGVSREAGYGGSRRSHGYENGVVVLGSAAAGTLYSQWHIVTSAEPLAFVVLSDGSLTLDGQLGKVPVRHVHADRISTLNHEVVVVRPDGYVAACCARSEVADVMAALRERLYIVH